MIQTLYGCDVSKHLNKHDPNLPLQKKDYEKALTDSPPIQRPQKIKPSLPLRKTLPPEMKKLVSVRLTESVPIKDVFMNLARQTGVSIVIDPTVTGAILITSIQKPFIQTLSQICKLSNLRYQIEDGMIIISNDTPYLKNYELPFLSLVRENQSRVSIATDVFSSMDYGDNSGFDEGDNGSNTMLKASSKLNFWEDLERNLNMILTNSGGDGKNSAAYTVHQQAGLITVNATQAQHEQMQRYLNLLEESVSKQVLIEAKIVEVNLSDTFRSGINWHSVKGDLALDAPLGRTALSGQFNPATSPERNVFSIGAHGRSLTSVISFLNKFGTVRTLSNPRVTVLNNQSAIIKVAENRVFFRVRYNRIIPGNNQPEVERASSDIHTIPVGLVMTVQPAISRESGKITLTIRPTISRVIREVEDPAVGVLTSNAQISRIPEVQVREMDSVIRIDTGEIVILGGLMEERSDNEKSGVPDAQNVPFLGALFSGKSDERTVSELVILLRVTVLDSSTDSIFPADERLYETFTKDPRPLEFNSQT